MKIPNYTALEKYEILYSLGEKKSNSISALLQAALICCINIYANFVYKKIHNFN